MKSVAYYDTILAQSNASILHQGEEREEMFEASTRVKRNQWTCLSALRAGRTEKKQEKKVNMKSVTYCDAILAQSNTSILHQEEEREEMFEANSRVKTNQWTRLFVLRAVRTEKNKKKKEINRFLYTT